VPSYTRVAGGNVEPMHFVTIGTDGRVTQAGAGVQIFGVSGQGTRFPPYGSLDDGYAAIAGESVLVHGPPEKDVSLVLGGTVTIGAFIKSDANGEGVASSADQEDVGAIALQAGVSGEIIKVQLIIMERSTA
jgi:hypothetical protein